MRCQWQHPQEPLAAQLRAAGVILQDTPAAAQIVSVTEAAARTATTLIVLGTGPVLAFREQLFALKANLGLIQLPDERWQVVTLDGAAFEVDDPTELVVRLLQSTYYHTKIVADSNLPSSPYLETVARLYPRSPDGPRVFGTFAVRTSQGFYTTTRGKSGGAEAVAFVFDVNHHSQEVVANTKATLNAPLLHKLLELNPEINFLIHGHELTGEVIQPHYQFPGTSGDLQNATDFQGQDFKIQLPQHGFVAGFKQYVDLLRALSTVDWERYQEIFPARYLKRGAFDSYLQSLPAVDRVLDVGGGREGTESLSQHQKISALDLYATSPLAREHIYRDYETLPPNYFNLIVCRGSFNYLTEPQVQALVAALAPGGRILANTFKLAPQSQWQQRAEVTQAGQVGQESFRLIDGIVEHRWQLLGLDWTHGFYYRSPEWLAKNLPGVKLHTTAKTNSVIVEWVRE